MLHVILKQLIILSLLCICSSIVSCKERIYLSPSGSDINSGSKKHPIRTIEEGFLRVKSLRKKGCQETIELRLASGTYYLTNTIVIDDECLDNISIVGAGINKTFISGGKQINNIINNDVEKVIVHLNEDTFDELHVPQVYVNDVRKTLARNPNINEYYTPNDYKWKSIRKDEKNGVVHIILPTKAKSSLSTVHDAHNVIVSFLHDWSETRRFIMEYDGNTGEVCLRDPFARSKQYFTRKGAKKFFFENDMSFLDEPGEYFYDEMSKTIYFIPEDNEKLSAESFVIPVNRVLFSITGEKNGLIKNISFKGISFEYTRYTMPIDGEEPYQSSSQSLAAVMVDYASGIYFDNCEFKHTGEGAIWFREGCYDCTVKHCYLHDLGAGGVKIGITYSPFQMNEEFKISHHIKIDNNIIREGGRILFPSTGISLYQASDCEITHNEVADFYYTGISVGWTWGYAETPSKRNIISNNHVHHLGWGALSDMGGIYTLGRSEGTEITNNIIHHVYSFADNAWGIYLDEGTSNVLVKNNTVYECKSASFLLHYGRDNSVVNNVFVTDKPINIAKAEDHVSLSFTHNVICCTFDGPVFGNTWSKSNVICVDNLCWGKNNDNTKGVTYENPGLVLDKNGIYTVTNHSVLKDLGFKKIQTTNVGVYGENTWRALAQFSEDRAELYEKLTKAIK